MIWREKISVSKFFIFPVCICKSVFFVKLMVVFFVFFREEDSDVARRNKHSKTQLCCKKGFVIKPPQKNYSYSLLCRFYSDFSFSSLSYSYFSRFEYSASSLTSPDICLWKFTIFNSTKGSKFNMIAKVLLLFGYF